MSPMTTVARSMATGDEAARRTAMSKTSPRKTGTSKTGPRKTGPLKTGSCRTLALENPIQTYAWGSRTAIAELLGRQPPDEPEAELWMGAHPKAPSVVRLGGRSVRLHEAITRHPDTLLGADVHRAYGPRLPFLLKVLAAGEPLSIQAHPDREQAVAGFAREEAMGLAVDDGRRNYRDRNHKPEILYALTPFTALRGLRPAPELAERLQAVGLGDWVAKEKPRRRVLRRFLELDGAELEAARRRVLEQRRALGAGSARWIERLEEFYPGDRGVLAPVFLDLVELEPGQALYTGPGVLHAYLDGVGIELMASSDNVLRCALTHKHVDGEELLRIASFDESPGLIEPSLEDGARVFEGPADELKLTVVELTPRRAFSRPRPFAGVEILFCAAGSGRLEGDAGEEPFAFAQGDAFLVPGCRGSYRLEGEATVFCAGVSRCPDQGPGRLGAG